MSIVPLVKVSLAGRMHDQAAILEALQALGCLHLEPANARIGAATPGPAAEALRFLQSGPRRRRQVHDVSRFDGEAVIARALGIRTRLQVLKEERARLRRRIDDLRPWGDFELPSRSSHPELRFWFYRVPAHQVPGFEAVAHPWQIVHRDPRDAYIVVVAREEPQGMPAPRIHTGSRRLSDLERDLEAAEEESDDLMAERIGLSRWCDLLQQNLNRLNDAAARRAAALGAHSGGTVFGLEGWAPATSVADLGRCAERLGFAVEIRPPEAGESPPTLLHSQGPLAGGRDLLTFYLVPGYHGWDPGTLVAGAFALFFALILSDAGYALLLAALLGMAWRRLGQAANGARLRKLAGVSIACALVWGVAVGSYFGVAPSPRSLAGLGVVVNATDADTLLALSLAIGVLHLMLANLATAWHRRGERQALAAAGWAGVFAGGGLAALGHRTDVPSVSIAGLGLALTGLVAVLTCSGNASRGWHRLADGLLGLTRVVGALGDTLSYLRLFALGFAGASLATAFNDLAAGISAGAGAAGPVVAGLVLVVGHGLNLILGVAGGVVHGLRLNFIEFFNWSVSEEGHPFTAFTKTEGTPWRSW